MEIDGGMRIANLAWYDLEEVRWATDALWAAIAKEFRAEGIEGVPGTLARDVPYAEAWESEDFLFGQACGYDTEIAYRGALQVVATPRYRAAGCAGNGYRSFVVVRADRELTTTEGLRGTRCAINTATSHSGMNVWRGMVASRAEAGKFFGEVVVSGSHEASLAMLAEGAADVAAVDCVTWGLLARHRAEALANMQVIGRSELAAAPPYVTSKATSREELAVMRRAVTRAVAGKELSEAREALLLDGVDVLAERAYRPMTEMVEAARRAGYVEMEWGACGGEFGKADGVNESVPAARGIRCLG